MQDFESILLSQVRDIHGLERVSAWPLATGWWLIIFIFLVIAFVSISKAIKILQYQKGWKYKLELELDKIAADEDISKAKQNISRINEILKRIAILLYGRRESASLAGKKWLAWLSNRDPSNYNWLKKGNILINFPYMKEDQIHASHKDISSLAKAAKQWLKLDVINRGDE